MDDSAGDSDLIFFHSEDGAVHINVRFEGETAWLTQAAMAELFDVSVQNVTIHLQNIYVAEELSESATCKDFLHVQNEGAREVRRMRKFYNLDAIIALGYRVNSRRATQFRVWATQILKEYIVKGFALDDERMKTGRKTTYFDELQERIREIRLSERVFYQKIKDIYTTSSDYDPKAEATTRFFKVVQNKLLWAISQQTAAELVARRANATQPFMGMTSCDKKNESRITRQDALTAKNYLTKVEIKELGLLVEQYLAFAEAQAGRRVVMTMKDWVDKLDAIVSLNGRELLTHAGSIAHNLAKEITDTQFDGFKERLLQEEKEKSLDELERDLRRKRGEKNGEDGDAAPTPL